MQLMLRLIVEMRNVRISSSSARRLSVRVTPAGLFAAKVISMPFRYEKSAVRFGTIDPTAKAGLARRRHQQVRRHRPELIAALHREDVVPTRRIGARTILARHASRPRRNAPRRGIE